MPDDRPVSPEERLRPLREFVLAFGWRRTYAGGCQVGVTIDGKAITVLDGWAGESSAVDGLVNKLVSEVFGQLSRPDGARALSTPAGPSPEPTDGSESSLAKVTLAQFIATGDGAFLDNAQADTLREMIRVLIEAAAVARARRAAATAAPSPREEAVEGRWMLYSSTRGLVGPLISVVTEVAPAAEVERLRIEAARARDSYEQINEQCARAEAEAERLRGFVEWCSHLEGSYWQQIADYARRTLEGPGAALSAARPPSPTPEETR